MFAVAVVLLPPPLVAVVTVDPATHFGRRRHRSVALVEVRPKRASALPHAHTFGMRVVDMPWSPRAPTVAGLKIVDRKYRSYYRWQYRLEKFGSVSFKS